MTQLFVTVAKLCFQGYPQYSVSKLVQGKFRAGVRMSSSNAYGPKGMDQGAITCITTTGVAVEKEELAV